MKLIAEALTSMPEPAAALFAYGPMGVMLCWFMLRAEKVFSRISDLGHRIDGLTKALLVDMVDRESAGEHVRQFAKEAIAKIDARASKEKDL